MRHVLLREIPYFCLGYGNIVGGGGNGVGGGATPAVGHRDKATTSALGGHAHRTANWTAADHAAAAGPGDALTAAVAATKRVLGPLLLNIWEEEGLVSTDGNPVHLTGGGHVRFGDP